MTTEQQSLATKVAEGSFYSVRCNCGFRRRWITYNYAVDDFWKHRSYGHQPALIDLNEIQALLKEFQDFYDAMTDAELYERLWEIFPFEIEEFVSTGAK